MAQKYATWFSQVLTDYLQENLPQIVTFSNDDSEAINANAKFVEKPQNNVIPDVERDRASLPATIENRNDTDATYAVRELTTKPTLIKNADKAWLRYDKSLSVLRNHGLALQEKTVREIVYRWAVASAGIVGEDVNFAAPELIRTTGSSTPVGLTGATGNRKALTEKDIENARFLMDEQKVPTEGRYMMLNSNMLKQLYADIKTNYPDAFAQQLLMMNLTTLHGFNIVYTPTLNQVFTSAGVPKDWKGLTVEATDNDGILFWQSSLVCRAIGDVDVFEDLSNPAYYGDIYSALQLVGGSRERADGVGVVKLVQDAI